MSILTQLTVSNELFLIQITFCLFLFYENLYSFLSRMNFISIVLIFLQVNDHCLYFYLRYQQQQFIMAMDEWLYIVLLNGSANVAS